MTERFQSTLPPDIAALAPLRRSLSTWLENAGVADPPRGEVVLATHEGAANAIEHSGNAGAVGVRAQVQDGTITIEISDSGRWAASSSTDGERGRGLMLIAALVSRMELRTDQRGTLLRLVRDA
jgi:serine/threonine-protein kinase RsbW